MFLLFKLPNAATGKRKAEVEAQRFAILGDAFHSARGRFSCAATAIASRSLVPTIPLVVLVTRQRLVSSAISLSEGYFIEDAMILGIVLIVGAIASVGLLFLLAVLFIEPKPFGPKQKHIRSSWWRNY